MTHSVSFFPGRYGGPHVIGATIVILQFPRGAHPHQRYLIETVDWRECREAEGGETNVNIQDYPYDTCVYPLTGKDGVPKEFVNVPELNAGNGMYVDITNGHLYSKRSSNLYDAVLVHDEVVQAVAEAKILLMPPNIQLAFKGLN